VGKGGKKRGYDLLTMPSVDVPFFLLAGGLGTRARPLTDYKPKPMFPLAGTPLIRIMISQLMRLGCGRGFVNLHHKGEQIQRALAQEKGIHHFFEQELSGSKILKEAVPMIDDLLLVVNGDLFTEIPLRRMLQTLRSNSADGVLLVRKTFESHYAPLVISGSRFLGRQKDLPVQDHIAPPDGETFMYTGVALLGKNVLKAIDHISFFDSLAQRDFNIAVTETEGPWWDLGNPHLYRVADSAYRKYMGIDGENSLSADVQIGDESSVLDSIVWEKTVIRGKSSISGCIVTGDIELRDMKARHKIITPAGVFELKVQP
jgi:mannose-1-phosphate guanylyltransferase